MKKALQNLSILCASLLVSLGICEIVARQFIPVPMLVKTDTDIESKQPSTSGPQSIRSEDGSIARIIHFGGPHGVRLFPNMTATILKHECSKLDVVIRSNSLGLRGPQLGPKAPDEFRILALGDSITFGDYLDESLTIPALLEKELSAQGKKVTVLNAGLPGASSSDQYYHYLELRDAVQPDLVLVGMYLNDAQDSRRFYRKALRFPFNLSRFLTWASQRFQLIDYEGLFTNSNLSDIDKSWRENFRGGRKLTSGNQLESRNGFDFEIYNAALDFGLAWNPESWTRLTEINRAFAQAVKERGSTLAMFLFPVRMQIYASDSILDTTPQKSFMKMCQDIGVECYDLLPNLRTFGKSIRGEDLLFDHCHYKVTGNEIVAKDVSAWLRRENLSQR